MSSAPSNTIPMTRPELVLENELVAQLIGLGYSRTAVYRFTHVAATSPDDVFGSGSSTISDPRSTINTGSSTIRGGSSTISAPPDSQNRSRGRSDRPYANLEERAAPADVRLTKRNPKA